MEGKRRFIMAFVSLCQHQETFRSARNTLRWHRGPVPADPVPSPSTTRRAATSHRSAGTPCRKPQPSTTIRDGSGSAITDVALPWHCSEAHAAAQTQPLAANRTDGTGNLRMLSTARRGPLCRSTAGAQRELSQHLITAAEKAAALWSYT